MDKNTITGFLLIVAIVVGFSIYSGKQTVNQQDAQRKEQVAAGNAIQNKPANPDTTAADTAKKETAADENSFFADKKLPVSKTDSASVKKNTPPVASPKEDVTNAKPQIVSLENAKIKIDFSTKGGQMQRAYLKGYKTFNGDSLFMFNSDMQFSLLLQNKNHDKFETGGAIFTPIRTNDSCLTMRLKYTESQYIDFIYTLAPKTVNTAAGYMVKFDIRAVGMKDVLSRESLDQFNLVWSQSVKSKEKYLKGEARYTQLQYKLKDEDGLEDLSANKDDNKEETNPVKWVAFKDLFFATSLIADNSFSDLKLDSKIPNPTLDPHIPVQYLKNFTANISVPVTIENDGSAKAGFRYFMGPLNFKMLQSYDNKVTDPTQQLHFYKMIYLGWSLFRVINRYLVIPLFQLLSSTGMSYGLIIIFLTLIIKLLVAPLTFKSFMSSAKMRVLKPQIDELTKQYPNQTERQKATMALYSKAGVNPMSGCVPMLLQMPILYALFEFFPAAIQFRQQSFLWATDLSTYDVIFKWHTEIPYISSLFDYHISLFCVLMTITNVIYTKFQQDMTAGSQQMPGMKWMMYLMPVVFLFVLNNYSAALTFYYFLSTLITILLTIGFRYAVNEEKLLAKLEENKKKPKKKSGFMARLEEAQRVQQQQQKGKAKGKK